MKKDGSARHYDVLTPDERFRLVVEARARDDELEVDRLERACPRKTYTMPDALYYDRRQLSEIVALAVALDLT